MKNRKNKPRNMKRPGMRKNIKANNKSDISKGYEFPVIEASV
jgi:hypothetical protein